MTKRCRQLKSPAFGIHAVRAALIFFALTASAGADTLEPAFAGGDGRGEFQAEVADTLGAFPDPAFAGGDGRGEAQAEAEDSSPFNGMFFSND